MLDRFYPILRRALFALPPESAHALTLASLQVAHRLGVLQRNTSAEKAPIAAMGLHFPNRIGLAAGFDKNARCIDALGMLGFGFIEIGTVTPRPQSGQRTPRVFRLPAQQALINRMGFPNDGAAAVASRLRRRKFDGVLGINIGKNADTPLDRAIDDYVAAYRTLAPHGDYIAVNVSSPNTKDLRRLQQVEYLGPIFAALLEEEARLAATQERHIPVLAKVSPDLSEDELAAVAHLLIQQGVEGVIATNTTVTRPIRPDGMKSDRVQEQGGLSGKPLLDLSVRAVEVLKAAGNDRLTIIGAGGIASLADAQRMLSAGATLVQVYTGLIYRGPALIDELRSVRNAP